MFDKLFFLKHSSSKDNEEDLSYIIESDEDLEMVELCVLYYNDDKLMHAACGRDYDIRKNEELMIEFDYSYEAKYKGLVFNKYEYYLHEAQSE